ncbi:MAG TPA: acetyl-CoA carboxylase biotin carboxyl carrier protein [candidate division Zixibacteria bacterium]|nr:acetyl-CoA carboxylase biotin carboxyl carrier protein [candidate division Zixibacteria bacterium]
MDTKKIERILKIVEDSPLENLEIEVKSWGGRTIRVRKGLPSTNSSAHAETVETAPAKPSEQIPVEAEERDEVALGDGRVEITSPIVGTFYRAPSPDSPPYVNVGDIITVGQVVCIVEAMKLMNEIQSEVSGVVEKILVENSRPVEFGQVLFIIKTE